MKLSLKRIFRKKQSQEREDVDAVPESPKPVLKTSAAVDARIDRREPRPKR